jgi:hypothetical protein
MHVQMQFFNLLNAKKVKIKSKCKKLNSKPKNAATQATRYAKENLFFLMQSTLKSFKPLARYSI